MLTALRAITYIPVHVVPFPMKPSTQSQVKLPTESLQTAFTSQLSRPSMHSLMSAAEKKIHCVVSYYPLVLMSVVIMHWYTHRGLECYVMYVHVSMHVSCSLLPKLSWKNEYSPCLQNFNVRIPEHGSLGTRLCELYNERFILKWLSTTWLRK